MDSSLCTLGHVQEREFWQLLEEVLGRSYGRALAHDQVLDRLGGMTAVDALGAGEEPRVVWNVLATRWAFPIPSVGARTITRLLCRCAETFSEHNTPLRTDVRMLGYSYPQTTT